MNIEHWILNIWFEHLKNFEYWKTWKWKSIEFWLSFDWVLNGLKFRKLVPLFVHFDKAEAPFWEITRVNNKIQPVKRYQTRTWVNNNQVPRPHRTLATVHDSIPMTGTEKLPVLSFEWKGHFNRLHAPKGQPYPITYSCIVVNCIIVHHCHCKGLRLRLVISGLVTLFMSPITQCDQWKMGFASGQIWSANEGRDSSGLRTGHLFNQLVEIFWN